MPATTLAKLLSIGLGAALGGLLGGQSPIERSIPMAEVPFEAVHQLAVSSVDDSTYLLGAVQPVLAADPSLAPLLADPSLAPLLSDPSLAPLLSDPAVARALTDPAVLAAVRGIDPAVLARPAVLEALRTRTFSPALLSDPVVAANLPAILSALPALERAFAAVPAPLVESARAAPVMVAPAAAPGVAAPRIAAPAAREIAARQTGALPRAVAETAAAAPSILAALLGSRVERVLEATPAEPVAAPLRGRSQREARRGARVVPPRVAGR